MRGIKIDIDGAAPLEVLDEGSLCLLVAEQTVRLPVAGIGRGEPPSKQGVGRGLDQAAAVLSAVITLPRQSTRSASIPALAAMSLAIAAWLLISYLVHLVVSSGSKQ